MQCDCDDTIDDPLKPSRICKKHFAWAERLVLDERDRCAKVCEALTIPGHSVQAPSMRAAIEMIREPKFE
jgi:hypothetical protein